MSTQTPAPDASPDSEATAIDAAVAASSSYELLKTRLEKQGDALLAKAQALNAARLAAFGQMEQRLLLRTRARTEHACVARDIVRIGEDRVLLGFNVFLGLRRETDVDDVFALYELVPASEAAGEGGEGGGDELRPVPAEGSFLDDARFKSDFNELYTYYKQATLQQLRITPDWLLAAFQIGAQRGDIRVFRWRVEAGGALTYVDNRGERDIALPDSHDFAWTPVTREQHVGGRHPHINILDTVFVETTGGDLTVKVEDNTDTGLGIYSEPVQDANQALGDAEVAYARLGMLILLRVRPYREPAPRYLVFNVRTRQVARIDAIGASCVQLPEDHGIVFPGGYYLQSGEHKRFDLPAELAGALRFKRMLRSPNGEDVAYVFYGAVPAPAGAAGGGAPDAGLYAIFTYNLIDKQLAAPILADGYARFADGRLLVFQATRGEATRVHPMQVWQTPFAHEEYAAQQQAGTGFYGRVGNPDLVRGVSDLMGIARALREQAPTRAAYDDLIAQCQRARDAYFWLDAAEAGQAAADLQAIEQAARATLAEFEKVEAMRSDTARALDRAEGAQRELLGEIGAQLWRAPREFVLALGRLRTQAGALHGLRELRYADTPRIDALAAALAAEQQRVGERAMVFLADDKAFDGPQQALDKVAAALPQAGTASQLAELLATLDDEAAGLDLLSEQVGSLPGGDAVQRTAILDRVARLYADINRLRADARLRRGTLGAAEQRAEFGAQFKLFAQAVENALELADTPEKCDEALTRLLTQLEELEARFAEQDAFVADIAQQREAVVEALAARRQSLLDARQRRAKTLADAATRILDGAARRASALGEVAQVHAWFAADPLLAKLREQLDELRRLGAVVAADDLATRLATTREQAVRAVRDRHELAGEGEGGTGESIRLGTQRFSVNRQPVDLTLVAHEHEGQPGLAWQITGTDYLAPVRDARLDALRPFWGQTLVSETPLLARAEYLAAAWLDALHAQAPHDAHAAAALAALDTPAEADPPLGTDAAAARDTALRESLRRLAASRYQEGYQRGIHDDDALALARVLVPMQARAGLLRYGPAERALTLLYWLHGLREEGRATLARQARHAAQIEQLFGQPQARAAVQAEAAQALAAWLDDAPRVRATLLPDLAAALDAQAPAAIDPAALAATLCADAAAYLVRELAAPEHAGDDTPGWVIGGAGQDLAQALLRAIDHGGLAAAWQRDLAAADGPERWRLARGWVQAFAQAQVRAAHGTDASAAERNPGNPGNPGEPGDAGHTEAQAAAEAEAAERLAAVDDAATALAFAELPRRRVNAHLGARVGGLRSEHPRIHSGALHLDLNDFWRRVRHHRSHAEPGFAALQSLRHDLLAEEKTRLGLAQFQARPLSTFVRNRLIDEVYLPLIGHNLAKQIGAAGAGHSDRSGLLLLISPPGYGKTTLMEYLADRLGLVFVRINGPALGHSVTALDPDSAPNSAARLELDKLNLGLAMGSNVMLYLDDIQHTHPEFLQKFIALADATRRIEGVWQGRARTWDMRGKRFAIVMAGNPYTESGELFRIPDMLANRADIYNLGDVLAGREAQFALSYIENSLTSHPVTQPLAMREPQDVAHLVRFAQGEALDTGALAHPYSAAELDEIKHLLQRMFRVRDVLLQVNRAYIESAAQDERWRTAPPFRLQGSYRNMARLAPRLTPLMTDAELAELLRDHYRGEAQTLTSGAEENLLQLAHLIGQPSEQETARWQAIVADYQRLKKLGGAADDPALRVTGGLLDIARSVDALHAARPADQLGEKLGEVLGERLGATLGTLLGEHSQRLATPLAAPLAAIARHLAEPPAAPPPSAESQALTALAQHLQAGTSAAQTQLREALAATAAALHALQASTQTLHQHSDRAKEQGMVDALLSLSVTYRQLILPLVRAVESRVGEDAQLRQQIQQLEGEFERLGKRPK